QRLGGAGVEDAVGVVAGHVAGVMDVVAGDQAGGDCHGGAVVRDVVVLDGHAGGVTVDVVDGVADPAGRRVLAADERVLDGDAGGVPQGDAEVPAGNDLDAVDDDVVRRD